MRLTGGTRPIQTDVRHIPKDSPYFVAFSFGFGPGFGFGFGVGRETPMLNRK
jgi:hypothetical protein